jgi:hypothetical protein
MSTSALMMIVKENDILPPKLGSPRDLWGRFRSESKGVVLFRHFDAEPEGVKKDIAKGLSLAQKLLFFTAEINESTVSSCIIAATMKVMPVQAVWCPLPEEQINQISPVFHYLLILDPVNQT